MLNICPNAGPTRVIILFLIAGGAPVPDIKGTSEEPQKGIPMTKGSTLFFFMDSTRTRFVAKAWIMTDAAEMKEQSDDDGEKNTNCDVKSKFHIKVWTEFSTDKDEFDRDFRRVKYPSFDRDWKNKSTNL